MDDWTEFLQTCTNEQYAACTVVIDGERCGNVGIRAKGNTSLASVAAYGNDRYSFKIEFDHYETGKSYYGLDKLSLNNLIQDKTYLKDYVAYTLMNQMGVASPLCSFVEIRVNGEAWGLYLAVEGVEESFLQRNYGGGYGQLYKPDSISMGGGRGMGKDFDMDEFSETVSPSAGQAEDAESPWDARGATPRMPSGDFSPPENFGEDFDPSAMFGEGGSFPAMPEGDFDGSAMPDMGGFGGVGGEDVRLQYIDDDPSSYPNIFGSAKTKVSGRDQARLIESLKKLSEGDEIESAVDVEAVIRYLVVHNFLCNDDSYTGMMVHNYYLYEDDGKLSLIPWDYNLAFGGFSMGGLGTSGDGATRAVNSPIDSPVSSGDISSRPMIAWIFESEEYTALYHEIYGEFIAQIFDSGWFETEIARVAEMIAPYVQSDATAFFSYEEFEQGVSTLQAFCALRAQSIAGQLEGSVPSTTADQRANPQALVDASHLSLSDMGEFGMGGMGGMGGGMPQMGNRPDTAGGFPDSAAESLGRASGLTGEMPAFSAEESLTARREGGDAAANAYILLAGCTGLLMAAMILAKVYRINR